MTHQLIDHHGRLSLQLTDQNQFDPIFVDFLEGKLAHRKKYGGGKNQLIAKAVGIKPHVTLKILDVTAGLGRDAFVLATLGCEVLMCERSPIIFALLQDGLQRARQESWFCALSLSATQIDAIDYLEKTKDAPDVIYMDPMFPEKTKSALVKKEMRMLRAVVGDDGDAEKLFAMALCVAKKRVVVKRAKLAPTLTDQKPDIIYHGKSSRFDVYLTGQSARTSDQEAVWLII